MIFDGRKHRIDFDLFVGHGLDLEERRKIISKIKYKY